MIKQHTKTIDETKREIQYERSTNQKRILTSRPNSVPEFVHVIFNPKKPNHCLHIFRLN
jgi:hypothetical protein